MSMRNEISARMSDHSRIDKLGEQLRHRQEVIQAHVRDKHHLSEKCAKLEQDFKTMEERNITLVRW